MKLYKYRADIYRDLLTLVNNQIYVPTVNNLNDPAETLVNDNSLYHLFEFTEKHTFPGNSTKEFYEKSLKYLRTKMGVFSLSRNVTNEQLWSHYSNGHFGFCIEYDYERVKESLSNNKLNDILTIEYKNSLPVLSMKNLSKHDDNPIYLKQCLLGTKSKAWKHEEEIRFILKSSGLIDVQSEVVTGIYFGVRMLESDKILIRSSLKGKNIIYYQMKLKPNSYLLEAELIK